MNNDTNFITYTLFVIPGVLDISSTGDGSTVCELTLSGIN